MRTFFPLLFVLALAACGDEPSVEERFNALAADVENKAALSEAEAENLVIEEERRLADEANALLSQQANGLGNAAEVEVNASE